jgi:hypothetical protein
MCHRLPIGPRLDLDTYTLPLAETLITKLQIVQLNDKDLKDILLLFHQHEVAGQGDTETINLSAMALPCAADWGLFKTVTDNLSLVLERLPGAGPGQTDNGLIAERVRKAVEAIGRQPKSAAWKLRAVVGTRVRWYELPEEVTGAIEVVSG